MLVATYYGFNILFDSKENDETELYYYLRDKVMLLFKDYDEIHLEIYKQKHKNIKEFTFHKNENKIHELEIAINKITQLIKKHGNINLLCHVRTDFTEMM